MATITSVAIDLSDDLRAIDRYAGNRPLVAELILTAEAKIATLTAHLMDTRRAHGMSACATIIDMRAA